VDSQAVAVIGAHTTPYRRRLDEQSLEEMVFEASRGALADASLSIEDIDAVMLSATDQVEGRVIESMVTTGPAGGAGRDVTTLASAGEHAFVYAVMRLRAGQAKRVLVVVHSKESEGLDPRHADLLGAEPFLLRPLGMTSVVAAGLQASAYCAAHGYDEDAVSAVREARLAAARTTHGSGVDGPGAPHGQAAPSDEQSLAAWPLTWADLPRGCDSATAVVLAAGDAVTDGQTPAWVQSVGWVTGRYDLGERDLSRFESLEAATRMALEGQRPVSELDVVEVQEISTVAAFAACEALGLAAPGQGATAATGSSPVVNPSGGNLPVNPGNAAGLQRLLAAAQQVRGRTGSTQVDPRPRRSLGAALHGLAGQGAAVAVFTADRGEVA